MSLEGLLGQMVGLPVAYGNMYTNMYNSMYNPMYSYGQSQAGNMAQLGGQSMGLYGNLAGQQASMYQAELPMQMEQAKWNSIAPALSGLLGQIGFGGANISPLAMQFNRPDVMSGYGSAVNSAYQNARGYDGWMQQNFAGHQQAMQNAMPPNPFAAQAQQAQQPMPPRPRSPARPQVDIDSGWYEHGAPSRPILLAPGSMFPNAPVPSTGPSIRRS